MAAERARFWAKKPRHISSSELSTAVLPRLPRRTVVVRFLPGHPSSASPDTDGRHDRTGHGTWMLLAVFVARDNRPWLSVTGTCVAGFGLFAPGMDPRACDGWTTVCPLWLLRDPLIRRDFIGSRRATGWH